MYKNESFMSLGSLRVLMPRPLAALVPKRVHPRILPFSASICINCDMRLSGLQKGVLSLYRQCLREIQKKPAVCHLLFKAH